MPRWDMVHEAPMAVFLIVVGKSSAVCRAITTYNDESQNLPSAAIISIAVLKPIRQTKSSLSHKMYTDAASEFVFHTYFLVKT